MWREWSGACVKGRGVLQNGGWGSMKLRAVALGWRFKLQFSETHCSLRICCIPHLWIVWAPVLRACCGSMTGKDNYLRSMASYHVQVYVGTLSLQAHAHHRIKGQTVICLHQFVSGFLRPQASCPTDVTGRSILSVWGRCPGWFLCVHFLQYSYHPIILGRREGNFKFHFCQHQHQNQSRNSSFVKPWSKNNSKWQL